MTNRLPGNPESTCVGPTSYTVAPTTAAATRARAPMFTERMLATTNTSTRTIRAITSADTTTPLSDYGPRSLRRWAGTTAAAFVGTGHSQVGSSGAGSVLQVGELA